MLATATRHWCCCRPRKHSVPFSVLASLRNGLNTFSSRRHAGPAWFRPDARDVVLSVFKSYAVERVPAALVTARLEQVGTSRSQNRPETLPAEMGSG
jgi:hypothetical protein